MYVALSVRARLVRLVETETYEILDKYLTRLLALTLPARKQRGHTYANIVKKNAQWTSTDPHTHIRVMI